MIWLWFPSGMYVVPLPTLDVLGVDSAFSGSKRGSKPQID